MQVTLRTHLGNEFGVEAAARHWEIFEALRAERGYSDYRAHRCALGLGALNDTRMLEMSGVLVDYPFDDRLYPDAHYGRVPVPATLRVDPHTLLRIRRPTHGPAGALWGNLRDKIVVV